MRQNVFILKVFNLINNQQLIIANAKNINTGSYITNSTSFKVSWICRVDVGKETSNKTRGFEPGQDTFNELFRILVKMRPLYKLRHFSW